MPSLEAHILYPADQDETERSPAEADIGTTGVWAEPVDGDAQDIAYWPPGAAPRKTPIVVTFDMKADDLDARVAEATESVYIYDGLPGLQQWEQALHGNAVENPLSHLLEPLPGLRGEQADFAPGPGRYRQRLLTAFETYTRDLPDRKKQVQATVRQTAVTRALERLKDSRDQVQTETARYLLLPRADAEGAKEFLAAGERDAQLAGPDVSGLAADLLVIAQARRAVDQRTQEYARTVEAWDRAKREIVMSDLNKRTAARGYVTEAELLQAARAIDKIGDSEAVRQARERVGSERAALVELVARKAAGRPVLFRLWHTDVPYQVEQAVGAVGTGTAAADPTVLSGIVPLRDAVVSALMDTWEAAGKLQERIVDDGSTVWRFRPVIRDALTARHVDESNFAWRAAEDRMAEEDPGAVLRTLSQWLGYVGIAAALSGVGEPVAVAANLADLAVQTVIIIEKILAAIEQQLGADAFLSPSAGFAVDQSYAGIAVDVFFLALGLFFSRGDIAALRGAK